MMYLFLAGRLLFGGFFIMSGIKHFTHLASMTGYSQHKGVPMPKASVIVTGIMLLLGGLGILLGVHVGCAVVLLTIFLLGAAFKMHAYWTVADPAARMGDQVNFYKDLALIGGLLMILSIPTPWIWSLVM